MNIEDLDLYKACAEEMNDPVFGKSTHATATGYRDGCRGPMCTYARSRARSDRTGGSNFLSNDLIEYLIVLNWATATGRKRKIYTAPRNVMIFYSRLKMQGLTQKIDEHLDAAFPFVGVPASQAASEDTSAA